MWDITIVNDYERYILQGITFSLNSRRKYSMIDSLQLSVSTFLDKQSKEIIISLEEIIPAMLSLVQNYHETIQTKLFISRCLRWFAFRIEMSLNKARSSSFSSSSSLFAFSFFSRFLWAFWSEGERRRRRREKREFAEEWPVVDSNIQGSLTSVMRDSSKERIRTKRSFPHLSNIIIIIRRLLAPSDECP